MNSHNNKIFYASLILILTIFCSIYPQDIESTNIQTSNDTTNSFFLQCNDSPLNSITFSNKFKHTLNDSFINFSYYQDLKELLYYFPGVFINELGSFGYNHGIMIDYMDHRRIEILNNYATSNEPLTGLIDINNLTVEDLSRIEYINGVKSFLYGFNSNSGVINLIKKKWARTKTFSKIRYSESAYEETSLDGIFSKNILSNWNTTIGFRRDATDGRYTNSEYDSWNLRFVTHYTFENQINTYFSVAYNQKKVGANGGIDLDRTNPAETYDRLKASVMFENAYHKTAQNDFQLGLTGNLLNNPSHLTNLLLYLSNRMFYFKNIGSNTDTTLNYIKNHTRWMGIKFDHSTNLSDLLLKPELKFGLELRSSQIIQSSIIEYKRWTQGKITADLNISPLNIIKINMFSRLINYKQTNAIDAGMLLEINPYDFISLNLGYSHSHRIPYEIEQIFNETQAQNLSLEKHNTTELMFTIKPVQNTSFSISYFTKDIDDAILIRPNLENNTKSDFKYSTSGKVKQNLLNFNINSNIWKFEGLLNLLYNIRDIYEKPLQVHPKFFLFTEIYFKEKLFNDKLFGKIGLRTRFYSEQNGYKLDNRYNIFYPNLNYILGDLLYMDAILFLQIGNAIVNITLENILNNECILTYYYPLKDRSLRLGINWRFED